jgi:DnaJ-class molecular chaperone
VVKSLDDILLFIERGVPDGHEYKYKESADEHVNQRPGEVTYKIETLSHAVFTRDGNNLKINVKITLKQALLGFKKEITHLDGHKVLINRTKITKPGEVEKIKGEGMPVYEYPSDFGDLIVTYEVEFPKKLEEEQKELFRKIFQQSQQ